MASQATKPPTSGPLLAWSLDGGGMGGATMSFVKYFTNFLKVKCFTIFYKQVDGQWKIFLDLTKFYNETNIVKW